jgi:hypothetical protein
VVGFDVDTSDCSGSVPADCKGNIKLKLDYTATLTTPNVDAVTIGKNYGLNPGGGAPVNTLVHAEADPPGSMGDTLKGTLDLGTIPCLGGKKAGSVNVEGVEKGAWSGFIQQQIDYEAEIECCGKINTQTVEAKPVRGDGGIGPGGKVLPFRPPDKPYPKWPGERRG